MSDDIKLRKPKRQLLRIEAAEILRDAILMNHLNGGQRLNETKLADELGISRSSLREAFQTLEREGLVSSLPNRGTYVVKIIPQDNVDLLILRELVEPYVVQQALIVSPSLPKSIEQHLSQMYDCAATGDRLGVVKAHVQFHGHFYEATGNKFLKLLWDSVQAPIHHIFMTMTHYRPLIEIPNDHKHLVDLIVAGDTNGLDLELRKHFTANWDQGMAYLKERGEEPLPRPLHPLVPGTVQGKMIQKKIP